MIWELGLKKILNLKSIILNQEREGKQQDASQETCLLHRVSNFREKRFGYG